ncbi:MAG: alpha/beta hydrolase [Gammaproteobacteria bacterium]
MNEPVFKHYTQETLDREYDNLAKVANSAEYLQRFEAASRAARERYRSKLDLRYGPHDGETLDVFMPEDDNNEPAPIQLFIHGGYWQRLSKNEFSFVADTFTPAGAITIVVDYALMPSVTMAELVRQCRASLAWTYKNAASLGGDPDRIYVSGHSAGGHLVAMLMATDWPKFDPALPGGPIRGACGISGLYDLEPIRLSSVNEGMDLSLKDVATLSPLLLEPHCTCPLLLAVGELEGEEYLRQSTELAQSWGGRGTEPQVMPMAEQDHFSIVAQLGNPDSPLCRALHLQMGLPRPGM